MKKTKIKLYKHKEDNTLHFELLPHRMFFIDAIKYANIWISIINEILESDINQQLVLLLTVNDLIFFDDDLYNSILDKVNNGNYKVICKKKLETHRVRRNFEVVEFEEWKYLLSVENKDMEYLIQKLSDLDALELLIVKDGVDENIIKDFLDMSDNDVDTYLTHRIHFNSIHIGLNIYSFNCNESRITQIFKDLEAERLTIIRET